MKSALNLVVVTSLLVSGLAVAVKAQEVRPQANPMLDIDGSCPGPVMIEVTGASRNKKVFLVRSSSVGSAVVPGGSCAGTPLMLNNPKLLKKLTADAAGDASFNANAPAGACGQFIQALDIDSCLTSGLDAVGGLASCAIDFETDCPDTTPVCGVSISGGAGCVVDGLPFCYDSGVFSYRLNPGDTATINFFGDLNEIDVFFAHGPAGAGTMTFFDAMGNQVGEIFTNGDCSLAMPPTQTVTFATPARTAIVTAATSGPIYIDTLQTNP